MPLAVDRPISLSPPHFESMNFSRDCSSGVILYTSLKSIVHFRFVNTLIAALNCGAVQFVRYRHSSVTVHILSGFVHLAMYRRAHTN